MMPPEIAAAAAAPPITAVEAPYEIGLVATGSTDMPDSEAIFEVDAS